STNPSTGTARTTIPVYAITACPGGSGTAQVLLGTVPPAQQAFPVAHTTGYWSGTITVPASTSPGSYPLEATCLPTAFTYSANSFTVPGPTPATSPSPAPAPSPSQTEQSSPPWQHSPTPAPA